VLRGQKAAFRDTLKLHPDLYISSRWKVVSHADVQGSIPTRFIQRNFTRPYCNYLNFILRPEVHSV